MNIFKKITILLLIIVVSVFAIFPSYSAALTKSAPPFKVEVTPNNAGLVGQYKIYGSFSLYDNIRIVKVWFRQDTSFLSENVPHGSILVNNIPVSGAKFIKDKDGSLTATLYLSQILQKNIPITILFKKEAGIVNPTIPAVCYKIRVLYVGSQNIIVQTNLSYRYTIDLSAVKNVSVSVSPPINGMVAKYEISFITGVKGKLSAHSNCIMVKFPKGTVLPSAFFDSNILINNMKAYSVDRDPYSPGILRIYTPVDIPANTFVVVTINKRFGIINPSTTGDNYIYIATDVEPSWQMSNKYAIISAHVQKLDIKLSSEVVNSETSLEAHFITSPIGLLLPGQKIYIKFPQGFSLPNYIGKDYLTINGVNTGASISSNLMSIIVPDIISNGSDVDIFISNKSHIRNPNIAAGYNIAVYTDSDSQEVFDKITILPSTVTNVTFSPLYAGVSMATDYVIKFKTGLAGNLSEGNDSIFVSFDKNFLIPRVIPSSAVLINNIAASNVSVDVYSLIITVPININGGEEVSLTIKQKSNVKNPSIPGKYLIRVHTSAEKANVESNPVEIVDVPNVQFILNPASPDGLDDYYVNSPTLQLSAPVGNKIFYRIDDEKFILYKAPINLFNGVHTVYAYAVDKNGNKGSVSHRLIKVDTTPPNVTFDQGKGNLYVNTIHPALTGKVSEPCVLQINGVPATVNSDLSFVVQLSVTDGAPLAVYARDLAGNSISIVKTVYVDTTPPVITLLSPDEEKSDTTKSNFTIRLKLSEKGNVMINGEEMNLEGGIFAKNVDLNKGENTFNIVASDIAGNETTETLEIDLIDEINIKLQIGSNVAYVGENEVKLDSPPIIENSKTLVPLRFILETFGAKLNWDDSLKVITITTDNHTVQLQIGSKVALINGNVIKKLDTPPIIKENRTLVPLRFLAETFGAKVSWDGDTKTITITYTP